MYIQKQHRGENIWKLIAVAVIFVFLSIVQPQVVDAQNASEACSSLSVGDDCSFDGLSGRCDRTRQGLVCNSDVNAWAICDVDSSQGDVCRLNGNIGSCQRSGSEFQCVPITGGGNQAPPASTGGSTGSNQQQQPTGSTQGGEGSTQSGTDSDAPPAGSTGGGGSSGSSGAAAEGGLVQCGGDGQPTCTLCHMFILLRDIFNFALQILASLAVLSVFIGGVYMLVSGANPSMFAQGVQIIQYAVIGIILTGASFVVLNTLLVILGFQSATVAGALTIQDGFFSVECDSADYFQDRGPEERAIGDNSGGAPSSGGGSGGSGGGSASAGAEVGACGTQRCGDTLGAEIQQAANAEGIDPRLLQALIDTENANGTNCATDKIRQENNGTQSCGLFQLNTAGAAASCGISCNEALDVQTNLRCAAQYLKGGGASSACAAGNRWNPGACSSECEDLAFTYCSRTETAFEFYSTCN